MPERIAQVALSIPKENLFTYLVPPELTNTVQTGHLVCVPLKRREAIGLVVGVEEAVPGNTPDGIDLKPITALPYPDPVLDPLLLDLARWMSDYYLCPLGVTIRALFPTGLIPERIAGIPGTCAFRPKARERLISSIALRRPLQEIDEFITSHRRKAPRQCTVLASLIEKGGKAAIAELFPGQRVPSSLIRDMINKGLVERTREQVYRDPYTPGTKTREYRPIILTSDQEGVLAELRAALDKGGYAPFLLHGITGSGKTEVYLRLILRALKKGLQAILLVPEISITHQLIDLFKHHLGDRIAILHSHLSEGERLDEWLRIKQGEADVVIGARSAIFAPLPRLGVIICDEEHDASYKQESPPRYQGRDVAIMRATMCRCLICLGSATPSLESFHNARINKYRLLVLPLRVTVHPPPSVEIIDMRGEDAETDGHTDTQDQDEAPPSAFSRRLRAAMEEALEGGNQVLIFQNRRGYSPFLLCPKCGYVPRCPNCSVSLTYHATDHQLRCHYCDYQNRPPDSCPHCPDVPMRHMGHGTQKVEEELKGVFPDACVARMDRDTTGKKGAHARILEAVERGETNILVGTQMITKGLNLPQVVMVGVVGIDYALNIPDFRSAERVFQVITQVAGRAGRGDMPGRVFIQTFFPGHYSFAHASRHDYASFYEREIGFRRRLAYPPFSRLVNCIVRGADKKLARKAAGVIAKGIRTATKSGEVRTLGPAMAPIFRLKNKHRYQILLKAPDYRPAHLAVRKVLADFFRLKEFRNISVEVDVDPVNML
ncbi:MAG: primosomal protein N' [bacterium]